MQTKVFGIKESNFEEFIKKINEFSEKNKVIATQTHIKESYFYAVIYFTPEITNKVNQVEKATELQINKLKKLGKYKEGITKQEAWKIISESK